jgi:dihydrodipicolinate synthase/N-acetylneuraminate lyase
VAARGVPIGPNVRRPLRTLTEAERDELLTWLASVDVMQPARKT